MSTSYPYRNVDGVTVWGCCLSSIGPVCQHRTGTQWEGQAPSAVAAPVESLATWADAFGVWHARITVSEAPEGYLAANMSRFRIMAREAIRREIAERQGAQAFTVQLTVKETEADSVTYAESFND